MSNTNTGGPAFPQDAMPAWSNLKPTHSGMTLRDYFAAKAMQGFITIITNLNPGEDRLLDVPQLAKSAYNIADAMLKERDIKE